MTAQEQPRLAPSHAAAPKIVHRAVQGQVASGSRPLRKGKRTENKERAYVAASRRTDRSIEARLRSAYAASNIHKERTGRSLIVSRDIVINDKMYEEEDSFMTQRHQQQLNTNQETRPSCDVAAREANQRMARPVIDGKSKLNKSFDYSTDIDDLFAHFFPNASAQARRLSQNLFEPSGTFSGPSLGYLPPASMPPLQHDAGAAWQDQENPESGHEVSMLPSGSLLPGASAGPSQFSTTVADTKVIAAMAAMDDDAFLNLD